MKTLLGAVAALMFLLAGCASDPGAPVATSMHMNGRLVSGASVGSH